MSKDRTFVARWPHCRIGIWAVGGNLDVTSRWDPENKVLQRKTGPSKKYQLLKVDLFFDSSILWFNSLSINTRVWLGRISLTAKRFDPLQQCLINYVYQQFMTLLCGAKQLNRWTKQMEWVGPCDPNSIRATELLHPLPAQPSAQSFTLAVFQETTQVSQSFQSVLQTIDIQEAKDSNIQNPKWVSFHTFFNTVYGCHLTQLQAGAMLWNTVWESFA